MVPFRFLIHIPRRAIRLALWTIVVLLVAFFAATRTQVGRDIVKQRLEREFAERFGGQLRVQSLSGNIVYRVVATGVELYDDQGLKVGSIDSVIVRPRWRRLAQGHLEFGRLYLHNAKLDLVRDTSGSWNFTRAISPRSFSDSTKADAAIKSIAVGDLRVLFGVVTTVNNAGRPHAVSTGTVFDYTNANFGIRHAHLTVDWTPEQAQVDVIRMSTRIAEPSFEATRLEGQLVIDQDRYFINQLLLETPASRITGSGSFEQRDSDRDSAGGTFVDVSVDALPLNNDEFRRLIPAYPLHSRMDLKARVRGPLSALVVEEISAVHGGSRISASGTLFGIPDSLDFDVSITDGRVRRRNIRTLLPEYDLARWTGADSLVISVLGRGVVRDLTSPTRNVDGDFFLDVSGDVGHLSGRVSLASASQRTLTFTSDLVANEFDVLRAFPPVGIPLTLSGDVSIDGGGSRLSNAVASVELDLIGSSINGQTIDSVRALSSYSPSAFTAELHAINRGGSAVVDVATRFDESPARYAIDLIAVNLDLGPFIPTDSISTSLNGRMSSRFTMSSYDDLEGDAQIHFDSTRISSRDVVRILRPADLTISVKTPDESERHLQLRGNVAEMDTRIRGRLTSMRPLYDLWRAAFAAELAAGDSSSFALTNNPSAEAYALASATDQLEIASVFKRIDAGFFAGFFPSSVPVKGELAGEFHVTASNRAITTRGAVSGDSLLLGPLRAQSYAGQVEMSVTRGAIISSMNARIELGADRYSFGGSGMPDLRLAAEVDGGLGSITVESGRGPRLGPLMFRSGVAVNKGKLTLTPSRFDLEARGNNWSLVESGPIVLDNSSIRTERLVLSSKSNLVKEPQQVEVRGGLSADPDERLFARIERLDLVQVSNLLSLKTNLGGTLSGTATLFKRQMTPILESALIVKSLTLDGRVLGDIDLSTQLQPGTSTVLLDVEVMPASDTLATPAVNNRARITGNVQLPAFGQSDSPSTGQFDLQASIERADMFFFEYIFPGTVTNVTGGVSGDVKITGSPSRPVFDADFRLNEGRFLVPEFNLQMSLDGDVFVDQFGVHIRRADVIDKTGGTAVISGDVLFNDYRFFSLNLFGQLSDFQIMDIASSRDLPFYGHIWGSGTASLSGRISDAELRASTVRTSPRSELYIPLVESEAGSDGGFIIFADSAGQIPNLTELTRRKNVLASRPQGERGFTEGMDIEINIDAPEGSTVHLVIDPLLGDVINGVGSGRVQILRKEGEFETYGTFQVNSGDYLFTAGEVFVRRFLIEEGGLITWDGNPTDALLDIPAAFRTRASRAGLGPSADGTSPLIPVVVNLRITGRVSAPQVALALAIDRNSQDLTSSSDREFLETILNDPQQSTEYATSVLLTNSFALTTTSSSGGEALGTGAFNSLSQLIATQLNRYLSSALPNVDFSFGVQGESSQQLDITYGVALRLLDERLVIRGEGVYQGTESAANESLQGEFVVELRLNRHVSVEIFYRREGDALAAERILTSTTGAGVSYRTDFPTWRRFFSSFFNTLFGWIIPDKPSAPDADPEGPVAVSPATVTSASRQD